MQRPSVRARRVAPATAPQPETDPAIVRAYLEDASGTPSGRAAGLLRPRSEAELAAFLRTTAEPGTPVLPQAARSSLTGAAVPRGEVVLSVERMRAVRSPERHGDRGRVQVEPGMPLDELQAELAGHGLYYPPVPTHAAAMVGGTVSTNAGGPATFKYGVTRDWVRGLRILLDNGDLLELERGEVRVPRGGAFDLVLSDGTRRVVPTPSHTLPSLKKISAGYRADDPLDLVDLFVGAEGTLGIVTQATLELVPLAAGVLGGALFVDSLEAALRLAGALRAAGRRRHDGDPAAPDVRAIELLDPRCLELARESGFEQTSRLRIPSEAGALITFEVELDASECDGFEHALERAWSDDAPARADAPLAGLFGLLREAGVLETAELAFPGDDGRRAAIAALRESAPLRVNELLAERSRGADPLCKMGGDPIVPFERLDEALQRYVSAFESRELQYAIWGHVSDGNLHPNAIPADVEGARRAREALLEIADHAMELGGAPLSEHGVGRSGLKQELLLRFVGDAGVRRMREVKAALDPSWRFAPGVLFPRR